MRWLHNRIMISSNRNYSWPLLLHELPASHILRLFSIQPANIQHILRHFGSQKEVHISINSLRPVIKYRFCYPMLHIHPANQIIPRHSITTIDFIVFINNLFHAAHIHHSFEIASIDIHNPIDKPDRRSFKIHIRAFQTKRAMNVRVDHDYKIYIFTYFYQLAPDLICNQPTSRPTKQPIRPTWLNLSYGFNI